MSRIAEEQVIGSLLMDSNAIDKVYNILEADMFTDELLRSMYVEFQRAFDQNKQLNVVTLSQKVTCEAFPADIVNTQISCIVGNTLTSTQAEEYAYAIVSEYKADLANKMVSEMKFTPNNYKSLLGALHERTEALLGERSSVSKNLAEIAKEYKDDYFKEKEKSQLKIGLPTLDDLIELEGGDMIVIGARASTGKSALVTQITSNLAKQGKRVGFYNLEMKEKQVYERFVVSESGIGLTRLKRATSFSGDEKERFAIANQRIESMENIVISTGSKSVSEIKVESKHMGFDIIIIDYLQLLKADLTYRGNRVAEVGQISKSIKALAMELNIPIIVLSQLNRVSELKENKEPTMSELRESGDIEQDASIVMLLWNLDQEHTKKGCKIDKNRQGKLGTVVLNFNGDLMRFTESLERPEDIKTWEQVELSPFD